MVTEGGGNNTSSGTSKLSLSLSKTRKVLILSFASKRKFQWHPPPNILDAGYASRKTNQFVAGGECSSESQNPRTRRVCGKGRVPNKNHQGRSDQTLRLVDAGSTISLYVIAKYKCNLTSLMALQPNSQIV